MFLYKDFLKKFKTFGNDFGLGILIYATVLHLTWGILLILGHTSVLDVTAVRSVVKYLHTENVYIYGFIFLVVGISSSIGLLWKTMDKLSICYSLLFLLPQQILLIISIQSAVHSISVSAFLDGVIRSRALIFADKMPLLLLTVLHSIALFNYHYSRSSGQPKNL